MDIHPMKSTNVTELRQRSGYTPNYAALARHRISAARSEAGMSQEEFATMLTPLVGRSISSGHVSSWETDVTPPGDVVVAAMAITPPPARRLGLRSHKFIAAFLGTEVLKGGLRTKETEFESVEFVLHTRPYGAAVIHLVEELEFPDITSLAMWRVQSYEENLDWASRYFRGITGDDNAKASYILSTYWVHSPIWVGQTLDTALRVLCTPRVLLDREPHQDPEATQIQAERVERELLAEGFQRSEMRPIGVQGVSSGYASWSGVVYHAFDHGRALPEGDLVQLQVDLQATWMFCEHLNNQATELTTSEAREGRQALKKARASLMVPQPQETGQHRTMRDAVIETSGLPAHLTMAMELLRETI